MGQTSSTVLQISLKAFEKLTKIGFRRAGLGHVKMLNFVFGRGASPPWTPYRGVAPGPQWGPRRPPHPRPNGPSKFWRGAFGPSPKFSRVIPEIGCCVLKTRRLGAQEAAYRLSDLKLTHSNIEILSVNIKKPEKRYWILKSKKRQGKTSKIF